MENEIRIFNIQHYSLHDGPGIRTVVFFKGCPLDCKWCHNPESKAMKSELSFAKDRCVQCRKCDLVCPQGVHAFTDGMHTLDRDKCILCGKCTESCAAAALERVGKAYDVDAVMAELEKDDIFFGTDGGVTFSGGEPFLQFNALFALLQACRQKKYSVCIETSGYTSTERILKSAEYTDIFLFDCKETDPKKHKEYTGVDNRQILANLAALDAINATVILRCPIIPDCNDRADHFDAIVALANRYRCIKQVDFMPYHPLGISKSEQLGKTCPFTHGEFLDKKALQNRLSALQDRVRVPLKIQ